MKNLSHCVYVLYSLKDGRLYIGYTTNLEQRLIAHNQGSTKSTASRRPFKLIFSEHYSSKSDALRREKYFKTSPGKRALRLMLKDSLNEI